jgi:hypothetical protein
MSFGERFLRLPGFDAALPGRRAQYVEQDGKRQQTIEHQGEKCTQQGAAGAGSLGDRHHHDNVHPGDGYEIHGAYVKGRKAGMHRGDVCQNSFITAK